MQNSAPSRQAVDGAALRGRGRPRAFDREAALTEATRLFWSKGYDATSIADLTAAMGIGAPSLYAAFGSKQALFTEALRHYSDTYGDLVWGGFFAAATAREAVAAYLRDSAAALTGCRADIPRGCMGTLSAVAAEEHPELSELMRAGRAISFERLTARLARAVAEGEIPPTTDVPALARFAQTIQSGMSILARDGAAGHELAAVADLALLAWDARIARDHPGRGTAAGIQDRKETPA